MYIYVYVFYIFKPNSKQPRIPLPTSKKRKLLSTSLYCFTESYAAAAACSSQRLRGGSLTDVEDIVIAQEHLTQLSVLLSMLDRIAQLQIHKGVAAHQITLIHWAPLALHQHLLPHKAVQECTRNVRLHGRARTALRSLSKLN